MNIGDIVKITNKGNRDLWCSGIVLTLEDENMWASAKTLFDSSFTLNGDQFDIEVVRAVEPQEIGSTHITNKGITYIRYAKNLDRRWVLADSPNLFTYTWEELCESE